MLTREELRRLAGPRSYERGESYFEGGRVRSLAEEKGTVTATVRGTRKYRVRLTLAGGGLTHACSCPIGADGALCKHGVAVGLEWLAHRGQSGTTARRRKSGSVTMNDVRAYLSGQDPGVLVNLLIEHAADDDRLRERLLMMTAKRAASGPDLTTFRRAIDQAIDTGEFIDYRSAFDYSQRIDDVINSMAELLDEGHAAEVVDLTEHALSAVEDAMGSVDDSDGHMGGILERVQELHHRACRKAKVDPTALAERLFAWELRTDWDTFFGAAATYADVLGEPGVARYRQLAEAEWARVPGLAGSGKDSDRYGRRFRITHIMETLARESGDVDAVAAVKARDLSHAYNYLQIAELYKEAGRDDAALDWAERGAKAFPERTDSRLREFLANEYHRRKRRDEAMALIWADFADAPHLPEYKQLKAHAARIDQWPVWRDKALGFVREGIAARKRKAPQRASPWFLQPDHSDLVEIFLWERKVETAWNEALAGGCSAALWMKLATKREAKHPEDAIPIYQRQVERSLARKNNDAYAEAVALLRRIHGLTARTGSHGAFASYLASIRTAHKPKRNFIKLLDSAKWG